jgi:glycosyltransferase involved in cell wall biosynthesis
MISVIIPTYKSPDVLNLCLRSAIEGQKEQNQIIVVVDGFYDINKEVLEKWSEHIDILDLEKNVGLCKGTNLGVYNAKYDKILIVNDDNVFPRFWDTTLEKEWKSLSRRFDHENIVISPNQVEPYPSMFKQFIIEDLGTDPKSFDLGKFWQFDYHYASGDKKDENGSTLPIFMSKIDYIRIGGWDENYEQDMVADWDFFLKCQLSGLKMIRTWNCHFYHFSQISVNGEERRKAESRNHEYAKYKWGSYIYHNQETNLKYIKN